MIIRYIYTLTIAISLLIALFTTSKQQADFRPKKIFLILLLCTLLVEILGLITITLRMRNVWIYNIYSAGEFLVYSYAYLQSLYYFRKIIKIFLLVFPLLFLSNIIFLQPLFESFHSYTYLLGSFFLVLLSVTYLYEQFALEKNLEKNLLLDFMFWISVGVLFFYGGSMILDSAINYLIKKDKGLADQLYDIILVLNILMYSLFAIGFSCHRIFRKSHSL